MAEITEILNGITDFIQLQKELGFRTIELGADTWAEFSKPLPAATRPAAAAQAQARPGKAFVSSFHAPAQAVAVSGAPAKTHEERVATLAQIAAQIDACSACDLRAQRTKSVPGQGNPDSPDVMFIGEAPGADEDRQGLAFVGAAGQLLTKMILAMGYTRDQVFIANICKCRPPGNRTPAPEEMNVCFPFLREQIKIVQPKVIVLLGGTAIKAILNTQTGVTRLQGSWSKYEQIPVMPTYHPAYILRFDRMGQTAELRKVKLAVWDSLKKVLAYLGKPVPAPKKKA
jgi:uracil-DNA glycosylase family 4